MTNNKWICNKQNSLQHSEIMNKKSLEQLSSNRNNYKNIDVEIKLVIKNTVKTQLNNNIWSTLS